MSVQITDELRVLVEAEVAQAVENMRKLDDSVEKTEKQTYKLDDALKSLEKKALILSAAVTGAGGAAIKFAADNEKLRTSLEVLLGSAEQAGAIFEEWKNFGATTPLSVEEIASAGKSLIAFGIDAEEVTDTMRRLGNVAQGIGARLGDVADIYGKARVQGRLFSNDINQFQGRGIPIVQALAKELGTTEGAIKEMVAQGKVGFPELERAFKNMTENGGQFEGMMDKLSQTTGGKFSTALDNAQQAAAAFGELLLPLVNDLLDSLTGLMDGIANMDDGTKRFILGFGGVVAAAGPTILAINGVNAAMTAVAANPYIAIIGGVIAAAGVLGGIINWQAHAYEDLNNKIWETKTAADSLLTTYADGNDAKKLDKEATAALIRLYPELAGKIREYNTTIAEAGRLTHELTVQKVIDAQQGRLKELDKVETLISASLRKEREAQILLDNASIGLSPAERDTNSTVLSAQAALTEVEADLKRLVKERDRIMKLINDSLAKVGKKANIQGGIYDLPGAVRPAVKDDTSGNPAAGGGGGGGGDAVKKRWQEWYSEITKINIAEVNKIRGQGEALGTLFLESLDNGMTQSRQLAETLGKNFDVAGALRGQRDEIERALTELLSIDPSKINDPFTFVDQFIAPLEYRFKRLSEDIRDADFAKEVEALDKKIKEFGMTEGELAEQAALAKGYTKEQAAEIRELAEKYAGLSKESEKSLTSLEDVFESILKKHTSLADETRESIAGIAASMAEISFDGVLKGLEDIGYALAQNEDAGKAFKAAMADMIRSMLDMLPSLFLEAGLRLIIAGNWPMGLAFIAMAGSTALLNGFTKGILGEEEEEPVPSARGNVFGEKGLVAYARGGAFTNQLVRSPTYFRHGGGFGVMGEAGPEAVMPLKRLGNGNLGVEASGAGAQLTVNIYNNSGEPVAREEKTDRDGNRQIDIMIGEMVGSQISSGRHDAAIESRFDGLRRRGR